MANNEITCTIYGPTTVTLTQANGYLLQNTAKLLSTVTARRTESERQGDHGIYDSLSFYGPRTLPFEGFVLGTSQSDRKAKERTLQTALALPSLQNYGGTDGYVLVKFTDEDGLLLQCYAKVIDPPAFDIVDKADSNTRSFGFAMSAKDPRLYSQTLNTQTGTETFEGTNFSIVQGISPKIPFTLVANTVATVTITNAGNFGAPPVLVITGPTTGPKVTNMTTGKFIKLTGLTLTGSEYVTIDSTNRTILKNDGTNLSAYWGSGSSWFTLEPGSNSLSLLDDTPSILLGQLSVKWRDTYI